MRRAMEEASQTVLERYPAFVEEELEARGFTGSYIDENGLHQPIIDGIRQPMFEDPPPAPTASTKGKGKGKGFEPFSGTGRRLDDDLNSLD